MSEEKKELLEKIIELIDGIEITKEDIIDEEKIKSVSSILNFYVYVKNIVDKFNTKKFIKKFIIWFTVYLAIFSILPVLLSFVRTFADIFIKFSFYYFLMFITIAILDFISLLIFYSLYKLDKEE